MLRGSMVCRTTWCGDLKTYGEGTDKEFKTIMFSVATNREYVQTKVDDNGKVVTDEEGKPVKVRQSDFFRCKANNRLAILVDRNLNLRKEDGKINSRLIQLWGHLESVKVMVETPLAVDGFDETIYVDIEKTVTTFIVESIEFLDANPTSDKGKVKGKPLKATVGKPSSEAPTPESDEVVHENTSLDPSQEFEIDSLVSDLVFPEDDEEDEE